MIDMAKFRNSVVSPVTCVNPQTNRQGDGSSAIQGQYDFPRQKTVRQFTALVCIRDNLDVGRLGRRDAGLLAQKIERQAHLRLKLDRKLGAALPIEMRASQLQVGWRL